MKGNTFVRKINFKEETGMKKNNNNAELLIGIIGTIGTIAAPIVIDVWEDIRKASDTKKKIEAERKTVDDRYTRLTEEYEKLRSELTRQNIIIMRIIIDNQADDETMAEVKEAKDIIEKTNGAVDCELKLNATELAFYTKEVVIPILENAIVEMRSALGDVRDHLVSAKYYAELALATAAETKEDKIKAFRTFKILNGEEVPYIKK